MARIKLSPIITDVRGTLGSSLTFQRRGDGHYVVKKPHPRDKQSAAQLEQRTKFLDARDAWLALSSEDKAMWNEEARAGSSSTGYAYFLSAHLRGLLAPSFDPDTILLLESVDQADGSSDFVDSSQSGYILNSVGSPTHTTTYGSPAGLGTSAIDLRQGVLQTASAFADIYTSDFTIEFWQYLTSGVTRVVLGHSNVNNKDYPLFVRTGFSFQAMLGAWYTVGTVSRPVWQHLCLERAGSRFYGYLDGVLEMDRAYARASYGTLEQLTIGNGRGDTDAEFRGCLQQLRISTVARYGGSSFTPPSALFLG